MTTKHQAARQRRADHKQHKKNKIVKLNTRRKDGQGKHHVQISRAQASMKKAA